MPVVRLHIIAKRGTRLNLNYRYKSLALGDQRNIPNLDQIQFWQDLYKESKSMGIEGLVGNHEGIFLLLPF